MTWRLADSLTTLRAQINAISPNRSKASDGTIGDAAHASRSSDHNPWVRDGGTGVVTALDITHDPSAGVDIQKLADQLVAAKDSRIKYIICNGRIVSGSGQKQPAWKWRPYSGANKHTRHVHISVKASKAQYDSTAPWKLDGSAIGEVSPADSVMRKGSRGRFVEELQRNLNALGFGPLAADGDFGAKTEAAVMKFQRSAELKADGWAGPRTLEAIGKRLGEKATAPKVAAAGEAVRQEAAQEVEQKTNLLTTVLSGGGIGFFRDADWQTVALIGAGGLLAGGLTLVAGRWMIRRIKAIRKEWAAG